MKRSGFFKAIVGMVVAPVAISKAISVPAQVSEIAGKYEVVPRLHEPVESN